MSKESKTTAYAKHLLPGDEFFAQGEWRTLAKRSDGNGGVWLYSTDGEVFHYIGYTSLPVHETFPKRLTTPTR